MLKCFFLLYIPLGEFCCGKLSVDGYFDPFCVSQSVTLLGCSDSVDEHRTDSLLSRTGVLKIS